MSGRSRRLTAGATVFNFHDVSGSISHAQQGRKVEKGKLVDLSFRARVVLRPETSHVAP